MYQDEWGNTYNTLEEAKMGVLKRFSVREIASEFYYHVTIEEVLEWCVGNAEFHKRFAGEFEATVNQLCENYVFEEVEENEPET